MSLLAALIQQSEIFLTSHACCPEVVVDYEHWDFSVSRNHDRTRCSFPAVSAMTALLGFKLKAGTQKNAFQRLPVHRRQAWHYSSSDDNFTAFDRNPRWALPCALGIALVASSSSTPSSVPAFAQLATKARTASSTARRAASASMPELATSNGIAWATYWSPSRQILTV